LDGELDMTDVTAPDRPQAAPATSPASHTTITLLALCVAGMIVSLQSTVVVPMMPRLMTELHTNVSGVTWLFTVALLTGAVATPLLSRFGDMFGKKRMIMYIMGLLVVGSVICALGTTLWVEVIGRALQGTSTAMIPLAIGMIRDLFPPHRVTTAIGVVSATMGIGGTVGMLLTGVIAQNTRTFHPLFWIATGLSVLGAALVAVSAKDIGTRHGGKPDYLGAALLGGLLVCLLLAISEGPDWGWRSGRVIGLFVGAAALCVVWVLVELRVAQPLVRIPLLVGPRSGSANLASALMGFAMMGSFTLISNFIQTPKARIGYGLSGTVLDVGLYGIPSAIAMTFFSFRTGAISRRIGPAYTLAIGSFFAGCSSLWLALFHDHGYDMIVSNLLQGIGFGIGYAALGTLAVQHVAMSESGIASGINSLVRTAGGSIAGAITGSILTAVTIAHTGVPTLHAYVICFALLTVGAWGSALVALANGVRHKG
jgi:MFS family permease